MQLTYEAISNGRPDQAPQLCVVPPLENGDRLTRAEFERRYHAMPHVKKAELIEGVVYMPSPVRVRSHGAPHGKIMGWLANYCAATPGVDFADNSTLRLDPDNEPQPDAMLWIEGGRSAVSEDDYMEGSPELVVEIAGSSASYDLHAKRHVYRRNGVREYLVWSVLENAFYWFRLQDEEYAAQRPDAGGIIESSVFPGLRLNVLALLDGDLAKVLADLQDGLNSPAHAAFVQHLANLSN
jgi:Uma2 family endonuclease